VPLNGFEGRIAAALDGRRCVAELATACGVGVWELKAVLRTFLDRGLIRLARAADDRGLSAAAITMRDIPVVQPIPQLRGVTARDFDARADECERQGAIARALEILREGTHQVADPAPLYNHLALLIARYQADYGEAERLLRAALRLSARKAYEQNLYNVLAMAALSTSRARGQAKAVTRPARRRR
jgi:tetratricopeptide (TPR) repeat protein